MVRTESGPSEPGLPESELLKPRWALRDWMAGIALFCATAGLVFWQNAHVAVLFDVGYMLNTAERIAAGRMPYRDFPLLHAPLTFLIQAAIIRLTGRVFFHHVLYAALVGGLGTVLTWRIALESLRGRVAAAWAVAFLLAAPITVVGIYCIVPTPEYDCDCGFWILVSLWLLQRLTRPYAAGRPAAPWAQMLRGVLAGAALCVPLFFKQNMGLPFLAAAIGAILLVLAFQFVAQWLRQGPAGPEPPEAQPLLAVLAGAGSTLLVAAVLLHFTAGLGNYLHWTIQIAAERRLPGFGDMLGVYRDPSLAWKLPCVVAALIVFSLGFQKKRWVRIAAFALLAAPFLFTLASLLIYDDADERGDALLALWPLLLLPATALALGNLLKLRRRPSLRALVPLIVLFAINGTFMSQQLWGSTYGIWPLLVLLLAELLAFLDGFQVRTAGPGAGSRWITPALAALISMTLLICGGFYTASEERLSYACFPDGPVEHSAFPELAGLSTPGPYLPEIDELLRYAQANIPFDDGIVLVPGEEPFYFATGRVPRFPVPYFDPTIDPYSPAEIAAQVQSRNTGWLIVKRDLQTKEDTVPDRAELMQALMGEFRLVARLRGYDVYRR